MFFFSPYIENFIIPTDELIFFRVVGFNHQPYPQNIHVFPIESFKPQVFSPDFRMFNRPGEVVLHRLEQLAPFPAMSVALVCSSPTPTGPNRGEPGRPQGRRPWEKWSTEWNMIHVGKSDGRYWKILEHIGTCWKNIGRYWKILENQTEHIGRYLNKSVRQ